METDREVLIWFHQRLVRKHGESELLDYMHRFRWIIQAMPHDKISRGQKVKAVCNGIEELLPLLKKPTAMERRELSA